MKKPRILAVLLAALALSGCIPVHNNPVTPAAPGAPVGISVAGARGLFFQAGAAERTMARSGRVIVSAEAGAFGAIDGSGEPVAVAFEDEDGAAVEVVISQAMQLTPEYVLVSYSYGEAQVVAVLAIETGALTPVSVAPGAWQYIFARDASAWYVASGTLYRLDLATGAATALSDEAEVFASPGYFQVDSVDCNTTLAWGYDTWVYADAEGNAYAICASNSNTIRAQAVTAAGARIDFGQTYLAIDLLNYAQSGTLLIDDGTMGAFVMCGKAIVDNNMYWGGSGAAETGGYAVQLHPVTFDPEAAGVVSFNVFGTASAAALMPSAPDQCCGRFIGFQSWMSRGVMSIGPDTFAFEPDAVTYYDTAAVPWTHVREDGVNLGAAVANWTYSGGYIYSGPTTASPIVGLVKFGATASLYTLLTDATIESWSVVGGVLFYTNATGSYRAAIDTATGTLGTIEPYDGGEVTAVTQ